MIRGFLFAIVVLGGCTSRGETSDPPPSAAPDDPVVVAKEDPPAADPGDPWTEPKVTHLVAVAYEWTKPNVDVLPVEMTDAGTKPLAPRTWPALPSPHMEGRYGFVGSHGGGTGYAVVQPAAEGYRVVWAKVDDPAADVSVDVGARRPAALMVAGETVLVGIENTIGHIDFSEGTPAYEQLHERKEMTGKAYDLFARAGDWVVAIDDIVVPIYADSLNLDARGHARHVAAFAMPGAINGSYRNAILHRSGPKKGTLWTIVPYGILDGNGQDLARIPFVDFEPTLGKEVTLNQSVHPNVLEEHVDRATDNPEKLVFGTSMTPWTGLGLLEQDGKPELILLAAGSRGLLTLPPETGPKSRASSIDVGARCYDVKVVGERTFVLAKNAVVELRQNGGPLAEHGRTAITGDYLSWGR